MIFSSPTLAAGIQLGIDKQRTTLDTFIFLGRDFTKAASTKKTTFIYLPHAWFHQCVERLELQLEKLICLIRTDWDYQTIHFN